MDGIARPDLLWTAWGEKWGSGWWLLQLPAPHRPQRHTITAGPWTDEVSWEEEPLWNHTWHPVAVGALHRRAQIAKNLKGWLDCGSHWQEANSHAPCIVGLVELLEFAGHRLSAAQREEVTAQIRIGFTLLDWYAELAAQLPGGAGAFIHEYPFHAQSITPSDVAKCALAYAKASRVVGEETERARWRATAEAALQWLAQARPSGALGFCPPAHGVPAGTPVPEQFMTRDLLTQCEAYLDLARAAGTPLPRRAEELFEEILQRQFAAPPEGCSLGGQFATFRDWNRPELAWTHFLGKDGVGNDTGATTPHPVLALMRMAQWWPEHPLATRAREAVRRFAYEYFLPACRANPFGILPIGEFPGQGLLWFAGLWHGMNSTYGYAASLAFEFEQFFDDAQFRPIALGNLNWIVGLNSGIHPGVEIGCEMSTPPTQSGRYLPVSMIYGIGRRYFGSWKTITGSIASGFTTGRSFHFDVPPTLENDSPSSFSDEDWITFSGAWLGAIARLHTFPAKQ